MLVSRVKCSTFLVSWKTTFVVVLLIVLLFYTFLCKLQDYFIQLKKMCWQSCHFENVKSSWFFILILFPALWENILVFFQRLSTFKWWWNSKPWELHEPSHTCHGLSLAPGLPCAPWDSGQPHPIGKTEHGHLKIWVKDLNVRPEIIKLLEGHRLTSA